MLAVAAHARGPGAQAIAEAAVDVTLERLPKDLATEQLDAILGMVDEALRAHLESRVMEHREYRSELFRGIYKQGEAEGRAEGRAEGETKGKAESILTVLAARGIPVSEAIRDRILGTSDPAKLDAWLRRAATADTAAAVVRAKAPGLPRSKRQARRSRKP